MAHETSAPADGAYSGTRTAKQRLLERYEINHAKTLSVLKAFPGAKSEFKPHERSNSALRLAWTFVVEERLLLKAIRGEELLGSGFGSPPETWDAVLDLFNKGYDDVVAALRDPSNPELKGTVTFFSGPKQTADMSIEAFTGFMLDDQIHHRGQLSVYVRMAGGKVPAIYGPSADEPWN
jgi:uncharacterized damage-inducible protein DinB